MFFESCQPALNLRYYYSFVDQYNISWEAKCTLLTVGLLNKLYLHYCFYLYFQVARLLKFGRCYVMERAVRKTSIWIVSGRHWTSIKPASLRISTRMMVKTVWLLCGFWDIFLSLILKHIQFMFLITMMNNLYLFITYKH